MRGMTLLAAALAICFSTASMAQGDPIAQLLAQPQAEGVPPPMLSMRVSAASAVLVDANSDTPLFVKDQHVQRPIASITKLMTAIVLLESREELSSEVVITQDDVDDLKMSSSKLPVGSKFKKSDLLRMAIMSSENRAAHALARTSSGGVEDFVGKMNAKARSLGMMHTRFVDPTGLDPSNVSTAFDLSLMAKESTRLMELNEISRTAESTFSVRGRETRFANTNAIVREGQADVSISKTGYIHEAGKCLLMVVRGGGERLLTLVTLDAPDSQSRIRDAKRMINAGFERMGFSEVFKPSQALDLKGSPVRKTHPVVAKKSKPKKHYG